MEIKELVKKAHENAVNKGFWEDYRFAVMSVKQSLNENFNEYIRDNAKILKTNCITTRLMLIVGEVAEAMEGLRKNDSDNFEEELADIVIRVADLAGGLGIDLETEIIKKMDKNKDRPYKHGKAF
jgi:NTP pyrophosphatase (non-canonical NTP hydrolase)